MTTPKESTPADAPALAYVAAAELEAASVPGVDGVEPRAIVRVGIIGGGTMGAGIAVAVAEAGLPVVIVERSATAAAAAAERARGIYARHVKRAALTDEEKAARFDRVAVTDDWAVVSQCSLVIEAAFEDMAVKMDIFRRLDTLAPEGAILATNTSYLDVDAIAGATSRPGDVVGLHFFAPANIMRLLEIVRGRQTSADVLAAALALARTLKKQPVVAGNGEGFIGNRIFAVYRRHAEYLLEDGAAPEEIDAAMEAYGFAMGPFAVWDLSGLDVAYAMRRRRDATRDPGERYVRIADRLYDAGRLGRKTGAGWYAYRADGRKTLDARTMEMVDDERARRGVALQSFTAEQIQERLLAVMANEGAKALADGVASRPSDIDVAFVNGYGFPRARGGPMWSADRRGLPAVLNEVQRAAAAGGTGSEPAPLLMDLVRTGGTFAGWRRR